MLAAISLLSTTVVRPVDAAEPDVALVVLIVVDQLGRTYLDRYGEHLTAGFQPLMRGAAVYTNGRYDYANTETAPGHTTLVTGTWPSVHGITGNGWFTDGGQRRYSFHDADVGRGPSQLRAPTIADALVFATNGRARIVSVSLKDRAAIALGGNAPTLSTWYDKNEGRFVAGRWKGTKDAPAWFNAKALEHAAANAFQKKWDRLDDLDYTAIVGPDDLLYEENVTGFGRTFPRVMGTGFAGPTSVDWRNRYKLSPQALDAMVDITMTAIDEEHLGRHDVTDLLAVSFSSLDYAGHNWGSHSQEALDFLRRIDRHIGRLVAHVDEKVGEGRVLWVLTADHGVTPTPEDVARLGLRTGRIDPDELKRIVGGALKGVKSDLRLVDIDLPRLFLSAGDDPEGRIVASRAIAEALRAMPGIEEAYAAEDLAKWPAPFGERFRRSHYPGRGGDVLVRVAPHYFPSDYGATGAVESLGTGHGSPYNYDSDVPVVLKGPRVRPGEDRRPYPMTRLAPSIAAAIRIMPPAAALDPPLPAVTR